MAREPPSRTAAIRCTPSRSLGSQGTPHTPIDTALEPICHPGCMLPCTSPAIPPNQTMAFESSYPFATKPRGLSNVLKRFQAPILDPQPQRPTAEWSRGDKAAYGEQIRQKCHRVEQSSGRVEAQATSHPVRWSGSEELGHISTGILSEPCSWLAHMASCIRDECERISGAQSPATTFDTRSHAVPVPPSSSLVISSSPANTRCNRYPVCDGRWWATEHQGPEAVHGGDLYVCQNA